MNKEKTNWKKVIIISLIVGLLFWVFYLALISASVETETIYAGNNYTFSVNTTDPLFWDVVGNSNNMIGFEVHQDIYNNYSNITFVIDYRFAPDNFTIILFSNETKEIVKEVPRDCPSYKRRYRDRIIEVPSDCPSCEETEEEELEPIDLITDEEKPKISLSILIIFSVGIIILGILVMRALKRMRERKKSNELNQNGRKK